ncbi:MAG: condensation domain-containing protein [Bacillota bacterium]
MLHNTRWFRLSSAQRGIYTVQQFDQESTVYNVTRAVEVFGELDVERVEKAFNVVVDRHDALRTSFDLIAETPMQVVNAKVSLPVERLAVGSLTEVPRLIKQFVRPFCLSEAPLL